MNKPSITPKAKPDRETSNAGAMVPNVAFLGNPDALIKAHLNASKALSEMSMLFIQAAGDIAQKQMEMAKTTSEILRQSIDGGGGTPGENAARYHDACVEMIQASGKHVSAISDTLVKHCCDAVGRSAEIWSAAEAGQSQQSQQAQSDS